VSQADVQAASFQTLADARPPTSPPGAAKPATTPAAPAQAANPPATQQAVPQPSPAMQQKDASQLPTRASAANELSVSAPPSPQAAAAADAAAADLKALQQQIAANPPGGAKSDGGMPSSEYLGQTYDLYGDHSATPAPKPRSPDTIRRRARTRWRHLPPRSPSP
jgi:hypothetical protein